MFFKSVEENTRIIEGWASTADIDRENDVIEPEAFRKAISHPERIPILWNHDRSDPIGSVIELKIDPDQGLWVRAKISHASDVQDYWEKITDGSVRGFSIGYRPLETHNGPNGVKIISEIELYEISIVPIPANPECLIESVQGKETNFDLIEAELKAFSEEYENQRAAVANMAVDLAIWEAKSFLKQQEQDFQKMETILDYFQRELV